VQKQPNIRVKDETLAAHHDARGPHCDAKRKSCAIKIRSLAHIFSHSSQGSFGRFFGEKDSEILHPRNLLDECLPLHMLTQVKISKNLKVFYHLGSWGFVIEMFKPLHTHPCLQRSLPKVSVRKDT
jgi:hypothetical protein